MNILTCTLFLYFYVFFIDKYCSGYKFITGKFTLPVYSKISANYTVKYYSQQLDHFGYANQDQFKQRYLISVEHWCNGCPIFFYTGNEGDITSLAAKYGFLWQNANQFKAMIVFAEHRYYGESVPYGNQNMNSSQLGFLTTGQALADFAELIQYLKESIPNAANSPVIVFGGSYGGMLSAWFRMKYPYLAIGAVASSAPIFLFRDNNCNDLYKTITKDFENYSQNCSQSIRNSWPAIRRIALTKDGLNWLSQTFELCIPLTTGTQLELFISWLANIWMYLAMSDYPNPGALVVPLPAYPLRETCKQLVNLNLNDRQLIESIANAAKIFYNSTGRTECNDISAVPHGAENWFYQICTELVNPTCSTGVTDMFEASAWNYTQYSDNCFESYGIYPEFEKPIIMFGGHHIKTATNIIFSNGLRDPLIGGGVLQTLAPTLPAILIPNACHHEDLMFTGPNDPPELKAARVQELAIIKDWINDYYKKYNFFPLNKK